MKTRIYAAPVVKELKVKLSYVRTLDPCKHKTYV